jgi:hypothetical protein
MTHPERALVTQTGQLFDRGGPVFELAAELYVYRR